MSHTKIRPGDMVEFNFWAPYLAASVLLDEHGRTTWHEVEPRDRGLVVALDLNEDANSHRHNTATVMFARIEKLVQVHLTQLKRVDDAGPPSPRTVSKSSLRIHIRLPEMKTRLHGEPSSSW